MDLGSVLSHVPGNATNSSRQEHFLAIKISSAEVLATVWTLSADRVSAATVGTQKIEGDTFEGLLQAADGAVSQALGTLQLPAAKTIFGLFPDWIENGKIVEQKLETLKRLCKELDLRPLGYVLLSEAIENYLKEKEGAPLTAILAGIDGARGWVTLLRAGKNLGTIPLPEGEGSDEIVPARIEKTLKQFQVDVLPARLIIYDSRKDLTALEAKIMAHPWTKQLPFLHFPKVEVLAGEAVVTAVAIAGGMQMGAKIDTIETNETNETSEPELVEVSAQQAGFIQEGDLGRLQETQEVKLTPLKDKIKTLIQKIRLPKLPRLSGFSVRSVKLPGFAPLIIAAVLALAGIIMALVYFFAGARVSIHLAAKPFDREMEMTVSGQFVEATEVGTKKGASTGRKLVGEKAHGAVTIYSTAASKTFAAGTVITSPSGLKFTLNSDVNVASGSGAASQVTASANITAMDIGENYNLGAGTLFTIGSNSSSSYQAKNDSALSGGNSHEATVVTKTDQDRLLATLSAELTDKAKADLDAKLSSGQKLLPNAITSVVSKKKFSKDVDAEGETFSLDLTMDFKGITASQDDLVSRFIEKYGSDIPSGYKLAPQSIDLQIKSAKLDKSGNAVLVTHMTAKSLPELDTQEIIRKISGKDSRTAMAFLTGLPGVSSVEVTAKPKIWQAVIDRYLPWRASNIQVENVSD